MISNGYRTATWPILQFCHNPLMGKYIGFFKETNIFLQILHHPTIFLLDPHGPQTRPIVHFAMSVSQ